MDKILEKLTEHDKKFKEHDKRFDAHDKRFDAHDKRFDAHDKRFDAHDKRFDQLDAQVDFLVKKVLEHDERLDRIETNMATKKDLHRISNTLDKLVQLAEKRDEELVVGAHNTKHLTDRVDVLEKDMKRVKPALGLA